MPSFASELEKTLYRALEEANELRHQYSTLEHLLYALTFDADAAEVMQACGVNLSVLRASVRKYIDEEHDSLKVPKRRPKESDEDKEIRRNRPLLADDESNEEEVKSYNKQFPNTKYEVWKNFEEDKSQPTAGFQRVIQRAILHVQSSGKDQVTGANVLVALFSERDSFAVYFLQQQDMSRLDAVSYLSHGIGKSSKKFSSTNNSFGESPSQTQPDIDAQSELKELLNLRRVSHDVDALDDHVPDDPVLKTPAIALGIVNFINEILVRNPSNSGGSTRTPSFTLGIYGPWGSGKSTLLHSVSKHLKDENAKIVEINAWHWEESKEFASFATECLLRSAKEGLGNRALVLLIQLTLAARSHYKKLIVGSLAVVLVIFGYEILQDLIGSGSKESKRNALIISGIGFISAISAKPLASVIEKFIIKKNDADTKSSSSIYFSYLNFLTRVGPFRGKPVFFLIDDLDRCSPSKMLSVIETIHFIVGTGNVAIIACDDKLISSAIYLENKELADNAGEGRLFGERFLEKIVQVHFRMPDLDFGDLVELGLAQASEVPQPAGIQNGNERHIGENGEHEPGGNPDTISDHEGSKEHSSGVAEISEGETLDDIGILRITGDVLGEALKVYRIPVRKLKMLSNLIKLYTGIYKPDNAANAYRFITLLVMTYVDPHWLKANYFNNHQTGLAEEYSKIGEFLGVEKAEVANIYPLLGIGNHFDKASERFQKFRPEPNSAPR